MSIKTQINLALSVIGHLEFPTPQRYLICVLESIAMGASPHGATAYLFGH